MSKSKGNVIARSRWRLAGRRSCDCGSGDRLLGELSISNEILKRVVESYPASAHAALPARQHRRFRSRTARAAGQRVGRDRPLCPGARRKAAGAVIAEYDRYEFHLIAARLQTFCPRTWARSTSTSEGPALHQRRGFTRAPLARTRFITSPRAWCA